MNAENYNDFCKSKDCPQYIEWQVEGGKCVSCQLVGQSYDIEDYPPACLFIEEIVDVVLE